MIQTDAEIIAELREENERLRQELAIADQRRRTAIGIALALGCEKEAISQHVDEVLARERAAHSRQMQ